MGVGATGRIDLTGLVAERGWLPPADELQESEEPWRRMADAAAASDDVAQLDWVLAAARAAWTAHGSAAPLVELQSTALGAAARWGSDWLLEHLLAAEPLPRLALERAMHLAFDGGRVAAAERIARAAATLERLEADPACLFHAVRDVGMLTTGVPFDERWLDGMRWLLDRGADPTARVDPLPPRATRAGRLQRTAARCAVPA